MRIAAGIFAVALAVAVAGCEDPVEPAPEITIARAAAPDTLDPALAADHDTLEALWLVYTPLLTYRHAEGASGEELIAGLATDLPEISDDQRTYSLTLRKDLAYSDGTPAVASDFERVVDRDRQLGSPAMAYLREIDDIASDDATGEIAITLKRPDPSFAYALALPATAPLPADLPPADLSAKPPPGIGPYELATDGDGYALERSDSFAELEIPDIPRGNLTRIDVQIEPDAIARTAAVLDDELDSIQGPPAPGLEAQVASRASDRYAESPAPSTTYALLDRHREPFDDPAARQAVAAGVDSTGCSLIPPGLTGYDHDFDATGCAPDQEEAKALIHQAGAEGAAVSVAGADQPRGQEYMRELRAIGLDPRPRPQSEDPATEVITRYASMPPPFDFFERVDGEPFVAAQLDELHADPDAVAGWLELERYVLTPPQTYLVPLGHERVTTLFSDRMDPDSAYVHPLFGNDLTSWRIREGS